MSKLFSLFASDRKKFNNWIEKAEEYRKSENFHDSLLCFDRALEVAEKNNDIDTSEYEIVYLYRAWLNEEIGNFAQAANDIEKSIQLNDKYEVYLLEFAIFKAKSDDYSAAIKALNKFTKDVLLFREVHFNCISELFLNNNLSELFMGDGKFTKTQLFVFNDYDSALICIAYYLRGTYKSKLGNKKGAADDFFSSIAYNSLWKENAFLKKEQEVFIESYKFMAMLSLGQTQIELKNYRKAISTFNDIIEKFKQINYEEVFFNRAIARLNIANYKGAIEDFTKTIEINPTHDLAKKNLVEAIELMNLSKNKIVSL